MLEEAVGHLVERQAHVLQADLLADDVEGQVGEAPVHLAHHARQHGAVAHAAMLAGTSATGVCCIRAPVKGA